MRRRNKGICYWVHQNDEKQIRREIVNSVDRNFTEAFKIACEKGNFEIAKLLYDSGDVDMKSDNSTWNCIHACRYNNLEFAKWIYKFGSVDSIHCLYNNFSRMCKFGYFDIVKWMYSINDKKKYDFDFKWSLREASENNHMEIAKWLYSKLDKREYEEYEEYKKIKKIVEKERDDYMNGFVFMIYNHEIMENQMLDMCIFANELPKYLFY